MFSECESTASVWLCLGCGFAGCGRYVNKHGLAHFEGGKGLRTRHAVCMDVKETSVFW